MEFSKKLVNNEIFLNSELAIDKCFDVGIREFIVEKIKFQFYYVTGLCDSTLSTEIFKQLVNKKLSNDIDGAVSNVLVHFQVDKVTDMEKFTTGVLAGLLGLTYEGAAFGYLIDVRSYPTRGPSEPDTEKVVRGSRDGFTENIVVNTALIRRRIKDKNLRNEMIQVGEKSKFDVCLSYVEGIADLEVVDEIRKRIKAIKVSELTMTDKALEELIIKQGFNPYPLVRYTERPDVVATHLYQGLIAIIVDTSPSVILAPITFIDHIHHVEEYRQTPLVGTFLRLIRFIGIMGSIFIIPLWYLAVLDPSVLPETLKFIGPEELGNVPIIFQLLIGEIGVEFLRMAAIHTPTPLSTAMGVVAGIIIGQIAIDVGLFCPEVVLYVAISAIGNYCTPSYELSLANKISKIFIIISTHFFKLPGLIISTVVWILFLANMKSFNKRYLYPLFPLNVKDLLNSIIRFPIKNEKDK